MADQNSWSYSGSDCLDTPRAKRRSLCTQLLSHCVEPWVSLLDGASGRGVSLSNLSWILPVLDQGRQALWSALSAFRRSLPWCTVQHCIIFAPRPYPCAPSRGGSRRIRPYVRGCPYLWEPYRTDEGTDGSYSTSISSCDDRPKSPEYRWPRLPSYHPRRLWSRCSDQGEDGGGRGDGGER